MAITALVSSLSTAGIAKDGDERRSGDEQQLRRRRRL